MPGDLATQPHPSAPLPHPPPDPDDLGPEWRLIEEVCQGLVDPNAPAVPLRTWIEHPDFSWGRLIEYAWSNKVQAITAEALRLDPAWDLLPEKLQGLLRDVLNLNRYRIRLHAQAASEIHDRANALKIPLILRKGLLFEEMLYGGRGLRIFGDIDFMFLPRDASRIQEMMQDLGFMPGELVYRHGTVVPQDRRTLITYRLNPDHLPRFARATADPLIGGVEIDFACSFTWTRSPYVVPLAPAFANASTRPMPEFTSPVRRFAPEDLFFDGLLHLFREAFVESGLERPNRIALAAFLDVALLWQRLRKTWRREQDRLAFRERLVDLGLGEPVAWVLGHLDQLLGTTTVTQLDLRHLATDDWLKSWRAGGGELRSWHGDMRRRLARGETLNEYGSEHAPRAEEDRL